MSNSIKNLYQFRTTSKITQAQWGTTTFTVWNDLFTNAAVAITAWYIKLQNRTWTKVELFKVTVAAWTATISSRWIKPDGTSSTTYQYEWPKNTLCTLVVVEAQIFDKSGSETLFWNLTYTWEITYDWEVYFPSYTTTERDAITWNRDWAFINNETTGTIQQRTWWAWYDVDTGTVTPNADEDTAWKSEKATNAQVLSATSIWETWAYLFATPEDIWKAVQSWVFTYCSDSWWDDTYVWIMIPAMSSYTAWQNLCAKVTTGNTWACSFDFWPWAKNVKTLDWNDPKTWDIPAWHIAHFIYNWTNLILQNPALTYETFPRLSKIAWESITAWNALRYWIELNWETITFVWNGAWSWINSCFIWYDTSNEFVWQSFTLTTWWLLMSIKVSLAKTWNPNGILTMYIYNDSDVSTVIATSTNTINESSLSWVFSDQTFSFSAQTLFPWVYRYKIWDNRSNNTTNYSYIEVNSAWWYSWWTNYAITNANVRSSGWYDHEMVITINDTNEEDDRIYVAASNVSRNTRVIWFANNTAAEWAYVYIDMIYNNKQSWLTTNSTYYLQDDWSIGTSAWTVSKIVWKAISATEILINLFW